MTSVPAVRAVGATGSPLGGEHLKADLVCGLFLFSL